MRNYTFISLILLLLAGFVACERNDDEPTLPPTRISRLYVSFSDVQTDDLAEPYKNIAIFDPSDAADLPDPERFESGVMEGAGITFNPFVSRVFQGSRQDSSIKSFSVNSMGVLGNGATFIDTTLASQPALVFDHVSTNLYVSNNTTNSIHVYENATARNGRTGPNKRFELDGQPRGLALSKDSLIIAFRTGTVNQVILLENPSKIDSGLVNTFKKIIIPNAVDVRGIAYSEELDLLAVSDVGKGEIYLIENVRDSFSENKSITPARTINGVATGIKEPIDVAIDDREDKMYLYVADRKAKKVFRFKLSDNGNVAPEASYTFQLTPVSIYLDAR